MNKQAQLVQEIHREFETAAELYVADMEPRLVNIEEINRKSERVKALGFVNAGATFEAWQHNVEAEKINAFYKARVDYPAHHFITEEAVKNLCEKYGLVWAKPENFAGDIPEKNVREIEKFIVRYNTRKYEWNIDESFGSWLPYKPTWFERWLLKKKKGHRIHRPNAFHEDRRMTTTLTICAPKSHIFLESNQRIVNGRVEEIPDPVVLHEIEGGYIIVTKWGPEAEDEELINPITN